MRDRNDEMQNVKCEMLCQTIQKVIKSHLETKQMQSSQHTQIK